MLHVIKLINLELEEETNTDYVTKLKYIKNNHEIIYPKFIRDMYEINLL